MKTLSTQPVCKIALAILSIVLLSSFNSKTEFANNWPNWRGPNNDGVAYNSAPPIHWSETENVLWKTPIPGRGLGTPIIWDDQVFVTTAIELDEKATEEAIKRLKKTHPTFVKVLGMSGVTDNILQFVVYSINKKTGAVIWKKVVREQYPHEGINDQGSWSSASCVTNGKHLIAHLGSYGTYCFDMTGKLVWEKDLGDMNVVNAFGEGTSPVIYNDKVIIVWDHEGKSKIYTLNLLTGEVIWQNDRDERSAWITPIVVNVNKNPQIIVPGDNKSIAYNANNGEVVWELSGLGEGPICCPLFDGERVFLMSGYGREKIIQAVNIKTAKGMLDSTNAVVWTKDKNMSYVPSPLIKDGKLYYLRASRAQLSCVDAKTGKLYYEALKPEKSGAAYASPVLANGNVYIMDRHGLCTIVKEGATFEVVAQNALDDSFDASPAVVGNQLFLRGYKNLYCISE